MELFSNKTDWGITIEKERDFWSKYLLNILIPVPTNCKICNKGKINLRKKDSIINPYLGKCNNYLCNREIYLRIGTVFEYQNKTPASVLYCILSLWLHDECNAKQIVNKLKDIYSIDKLNIKTIYKFLHLCRTLIANYIRTIYVLEPLAYKDAEANLAVDESLFTHYGGVSQWVIGIVDIESKSIRLEVVSQRDEDTLKIIINKHIMIGNNIYTDNWNGYNFISRIDSGYNHVRFNHSQGHFGFTSYIESLWNELKGKLKKLYCTIRADNFIYYLREIEYRRSIKLLNKDQKIRNFSEIISIVGNGKDGGLLSEDELRSINYDTMFED